MLYGDYILKAKELTIQQLDNGVWYLDPEWRMTLHANKLYFNDISDYETSPEEVEDVLKLEVARRNAQDDRTKEVMDWLYDLITATVEPAMLQEETDYIKQVTEFMKANHSLNLDEEKLKTGDYDGDTKTV